MNPHDLFHQCYKYVTDFLFGRLSIRDSRDGPYFPPKIKLLSSQIQMNTLFYNNDERKKK